MIFKKFENDPAITSKNGAIEKTKNNNEIVQESIKVIVNHINFHEADRMQKPYRHVFHFPPRKYRC